MKPFRLSLTARILSGSAAFALIGAGLLPILGIPLLGVLPLVFLLPVVASFISLIYAAEDYPFVIAGLAFVLPIAFFSYVAGTLLIVNVFPTWSWALVALGAVPLTLLIASLGTRQIDEPAANAAAVRAA
jgi:hypothetical protein